MSTDPARSRHPLDIREFTPRNWLLQRVTCPNPFYLLSAACVIHATGVPLQSSGQALSPESLLAVIGGYAAILAVIAMLIVRFWKVWDDARSIFMILLLLFLEMALCADSTLQVDPQRATGLLAVGLLVAVAISEFLLRSLRLRLPATFRLPYYIQLALLFLYPLALLPTLQTNDGVATTWRMFAFPFLVGLAVLALWPAMRRGPDAVRSNGSPWNWGWYPWTLFVVLGLCLCLRSYTLCLSFDAATALKADAAYRLESIFGPYFLTPILFAAAVLLLEAGVQNSRRSLKRVALLLPALIVLLSFPGAGRNAADAQFIGRLLETAGSPVWWSLIAAFVFYAVAAMRGVSGARRLAVYCVAALAVIDRGATVDGQTLSSIQPWPLLTAALLTVLFSLRARRSVNWCEALALAAVATTRFRWEHALPVPAVLVVGHAVTLAMLSIGVVLDDKTARFLRHLGVVALMIGAALMCTHNDALSAAAWVTPAYLTAITLIIAVVAWLRPSRWLKAALYVQLAVIYTGLLVHCCRLLQRSVHWSGLPSFLMAVILLHLGLLTSALKAGAFQRIARKLVRHAYNSGAAEH